MSLLADRESGSFWDHVTGECLHGPLRGRRLEPAPLRHMHAEQALAQFPDSRIAFSRHLLPFGMVDGLVRFLQWVGRGRLMPPGIAGSMGTEDERRPRLEMGLGVWSVSASRYYPLGALKDGEGLLIDRFDDRSMLIYLDPGSGTPTPLFARARNAEWEGGSIRLDSGETIRNGRLYDPLGAEKPTERPLHLFVRWYGFSLTFPGCEIYADAGEAAR